MDPWTIIGWILLACIAIPALYGILWGICMTLIIAMAAIRSSVRKGNGGLVVFVLTVAIAAVVFAALALR